MTLTSPLRLGTRGSALALAQSGWVAQRLRVASGRPIELVEIVTKGDTSDAPVQQLGVGVFVSALRDALHAGKVDLAVHSYKDLPTAAAEGLTIAAVPEREDPADILISRDAVLLQDLPAGSVVGTGAPRRVAQLITARPDLTYLPIRGNVDTRVGKVAAGELAAVVLARAGLARLGRLDEITETLSTDVVMPAPAQGALAVECRAGDEAIIDAVQRLDHRPSRAAVTAERAMLAALEAGCTAPVAAYAQVINQTLELRGIAIAPDGSAAIRRSDSGTPADAAAIGQRLAADLLANGAAELIGSARR